MSPSKSPASSTTDVVQPPEIGESNSTSDRRLILKNTLFLTLGQAAGVPLSILMNAMMARFLGPAAIGMLYLGTTFCSFGFMAVDWGGNGALPGMVAQERSASGRLLGTSLAWRASMSLVVYASLALLCQVLGYDREMQLVLALVAVGYIAGSLAGAAQHTILGFERSDVSAYRAILEQLSALVFVAPILFLGGDLSAALVGHAAAVVVGLAFVWRFLKPTGVTPIAVSGATLKQLLVTGTPFVFVSVAALLQPYVDALYMAKMVSEDVIGWHASARRLIGFLIFPASALIGALYPTLCRLWTSDRQRFAQTTNGALRGTTLLVVPVALSCYLYPDIGVTLYSRDAFGPAEDNLRILAPYLFLLYFTMPLGIAILAAEKRRQWALVQSLCVVVSLVADPFLIPWFQERTGNGGLGVCAAAVLSEMAVLGFGIWLGPRGAFNRVFWKTLGLVSIAGVGMTAVALGLRSWLNSFLAAPLALGTYALVAWRIGAIDQSFIELARGYLGRKLSKFRQARS